MKDVRLSKTLSSLILMASRRASCVVLEEI